MDISGYETKTDYIEAMMKRFRLVDMREQYPDLIEEARTIGMDHEEFLIKLLGAEEKGKSERRKSRLQEKAGFESIRHLEDIDYSFNPNLDQAKITELGNLGFLNAHENVIIIGPPGVGKSMIATGIGMNACSQGYKVLFANAKDLVDRIYEKMLAGELRQALSALNKMIAASKG